MNKISIQDIKDYSFCSMYYKNKKILNKPISIDKYDNALKTSYLYYLQGIRDKDRADLNVLSKAFSNNWNKRDINKNCITLRTHRMTYQYLKERGVKILLSFHNMMKDTEQCPIVMFKGYSININGITVTGVIDYIRETIVDNKAEIQLIKFNNITTTSTTLFSIYEDLDAISMLYAFKTIFECKNYKFLYLDVYNNKQYEITKTEKDFKIFEETVTKVYNNITDNIYIFSPSDKCYLCPFKECCKDNITKEIQLC